MQRGAHRKVRGGPVTWSDLESWDVEQRVKVPLIECIPRLTECLIKLSLVSLRVAQSSAVLECEMPDVTHERQTHRQLHVKITSTLHLLVECVVMVLR